MSNKSQAIQITESEYIAACSMAMLELSQSESFPKGDNSKERLYSFLKDSLYDRYKIDERERYKTVSADALILEMMEDRDTFKKEQEGELFSDIGMSGKKYAMSNKPSDIDHEVNAAIIKLLEGAAAQIRRIAVDKKTEKYPIRALRQIQSHI